MHVHIGNTQTQFGPRPFRLDLDKAQFRHGWLLGKSGTGKSTMLKSVIVEAIRDGCGIAVIDPHGDLVYDIFNYIPSWRKDDLVYLDPESSRAPDLGVFDHPDKEKAAQALLSLLEAHAGAGWGPETAHIFRNAIDAVLETHKHPNMLPVARFIMDTAYAERLLIRCKNPTVQFFYNQYFKELKPQDRARAFSHPLNKVEELLRPGLQEFLCQKKSLNFVSIMDRQKILLCRVPKGIMGERPARVLGSLILSKINLASFRRKKRSKAFFVVIDEIHNFTDGIDFETMLAESRKAGVHYIFATQTTAQMRDEARRIFNDRIAFGNASHIFSFRVSGEDSEEIAKNFGNEDTAPELVLLPNYEFKALTMTDGAPVPSERVTLIDRPEMAGDELPARKAISWASANTGTPKSEIEAQIMKALA
jgi:hypothetical protein